MSEEQTLRIAGVVRESIVDGPGIRFVVFCQGCPHKCPECHNEATHDFQGGYNCEIEKIIKAIDENPLLKGVTFSGGEPVCQSREFLVMAREIKKRNLDIVMFSGYTFEQLQKMAKDDKALEELLTLIDILIDGRYEKDKRDLTLLFRGSSNQRIIDMVKTREEGSIKLWQEP